MAKKDHVSETPATQLLKANKVVSTKNLARQIGAKAVAPCQPEVAKRHSAYLVGIDPQVCVSLLAAKPVQCALAD